MAEGPLGAPRPFTKQSIAINARMTDTSGNPKEVAESLASSASTAFDQVVVGHGTSKSVNAIQLFATTDEGFAIATSLIKKLDSEDLELKSFELSQDSSGEAIQKEFSETVTRGV